MAKKKEIRYEVNGAKKKKRVSVPDKAINVEVTAVPRSYRRKEGNLYGVKLSYLSSRKKDAVVKTKIVPLPKGSKNVKLV